MALTAFQRNICQLIARNRIASGESYVAGGAALNELLKLPRVSHDVDLFHDSEAALDATWKQDQQLLTDNKYSIRLLRERPSFIEAEVAKSHESVLLQWSRDSAYRFFPLVEHPTMGLTLHPFDLATNKILALVGRVEVRDWIDAIACSQELQPLGYLAWSACAKDPGFSPAAILEQAARNGHYSADELAALRFDGPTPNIVDLSLQWRALLLEARQTIALLPPERLGHCVLRTNGELFRGGIVELSNELSNQRIHFHGGSIRGALPTVVR